MQTDRHVPWRYVAGINPANSLQASAEKSERNQTKSNKKRTHQLLFQKRNASRCVLYSNQQCLAEKHT